MGCTVSTESNATSRRWPARIGEVVVFFPGFRIPTTLQFANSLKDILPESVTARLSALRARIAAMAARELSLALKPGRRTDTRRASSSAVLQQALEEYVALLLGFVKDGNQLRHKVQFGWLNQEDDVEETVMEDAWYEVLSVLHLIAMLCLLDANTLLLPRVYRKGPQPRKSEEKRCTASVDVFLKAAGYLDFSVQNVLPRISPELRSKLPVDLLDCTLRALSLQALGQAVEVQLGLAVDSPKATLAVKRRLACEMFKCWQQAQDFVAPLQLPDGWGKKYQQFLKWKLVKAKAVTYYFHATILEEDEAEKSQKMALAALHASEGLLKESKRAYESFCQLPPKSKSSAALGSTAYLPNNIAEDVSAKIRVIQEDLHGRGRIFDAAPSIPDFSVALKPEEYQLPPLDPLWSNTGNYLQEKS